MSDSPITPLPTAAGVDYFRDTPLRYLGYANEVGESFGPLYPKFVRPSYGIAFAYVGADTLYKAYLAKNRGESNKEALRIGVDVLLWQTFASVLIPGKIINMVTQASVKMFQSDISAIKKLPTSVRMWSPTVIGLATIPFIIHPIDNFVDHVFDRTLRKWWL